MFARNLVLKKTTTSFAFVSLAICHVSAAHAGWTVTQLTNNSIAKKHLQISGSNVVWMGGDFNDGEIYLATFEVPEPGDFDLNGEVDGFDFLNWQRDPSVGSLADWEANYGATAPLSASSAAVPEPDTLILALLGCVGLLLRMKRRVTHR